MIDITLSRSILGFRVGAHACSTDSTAARIAAGEPDPSLGDGGASFASAELGGTLVGDILIYSCNEKP